VLPGPLTHRCDVGMSLDIEIAALPGELGFSGSDIHQTLQAGGSSGGLCVLAGRFDTGHIARTVQDEPLLSRHLVRVETEGQEFWAWGPDGRMREEGEFVTTPLRWAGQGGRLHTSPTQLRWSMTTEVMLQSLTAADEQRSLAHDPAFETAALAIDGTPWLGGVLRGSVPRGAEGLCPWCSRRSLEALEERVRFLRNAETWGAAWGVEADGTWVLMIVVASTNEQDAHHNSQQLRLALQEGASVMRGSPWREILGSEVIVETRGHVSIMWLDAQPFQAEGTNPVALVPWAGDGLVVNEPR
jgi:hypothetical protein